MSNPIVNTVRYFNSYNTAVVILYPMLCASSDPSARIWNGRDYGTQWREDDGDGRVIDLAEDCDGKLQPGQEYYFAADVVGGHSPWLADYIFVYDPNSTNVANVQWSGNAFNCGASFNGITTYPVVYDPDADSAKGEKKLASGQKTYESKAAGQDAQKKLAAEGGKATGVSV